MTNFDPYDALIQMQDRLMALEHAHNKLAHSYVKTEEHLTHALRALNSLQKAHLTLSKTIRGPNETISNIRDKR